MVARHLGQVILAVAATAACAAPTDGEARGDENQRADTLTVDQAAGLWTVVSASGNDRCQVSLSNMLIDGRLGVLVEVCDAPTLAKARSWRPTTGGFELIGADGATVLAFRRTGEDAFAALDGGWRMERTAVR